MLRVCLSKMCVNSELHVNVIYYPIIRYTRYPRKMIFRGRRGKKRRSKNGRMAGKKTEPGEKQSGSTPGPVVLPAPLFGPSFPVRLVVLESRLGLESGLKSIFAGLGLGLGLGL